MLALLLKELEVSSEILKCVCVKSYEELIFNLMSGPTRSNR